MASEKEILRQFVQRTVGNLLGSFNPGFRMFASTLTNYVMDYIDPYLAAFTNPDTSKINTKAASAYLKEETNKKIEEFMKRFEDEANGTNNL
jgi:hypothetical protein